MLYRTTLAWGLPLLTPSTPSLLSLAPFPPLFTLLHPWFVFLTLWICIFYSAWNVLQGDFPEVPGLEDKKWCWWNFVWLHNKCIAMKDIINRANTYQNIHLHICTHSACKHVPSQTHMHTHPPTKAHTFSQCMKACVQHFVWNTLCPFSFNTDFNQTFHQF